MRRPRFRVSPGFLMLAALFLFADRDGTATAVLIAWLAHECGHLLLLYGMGGRVGRAELTLKGARIEAEKGRGLSYAGELLSVLAGPGINLALAAGCARLGERWYLFAGVNLALGVFNLLPVPDLDGGRVLTLLKLLLVEEEKKRKKE